MQKQSKAQLITKYAIMFATIFVAMMIDKALSVGFTISTAACVLLVTFSFCFIDNRWDTAVAAGAFFGLASWLKEIIFPGPSFSYLINFIVPFVPRVAAMTVAFLVYRVFLKLAHSIKNKYLKQTLAITVATFFGLVTNTVLFLSALNICKDIYNVTHDSLFEIIKLVIYINIIPEYLISLLASPHIVLGVRRGLRLGLEANAAMFAKKDEKALKKSTQEDD